MPFSPISTWLISTSSTRWGSAASVEWSWYGVSRPDCAEKLFGYFVWGKRAVQVEVMAGCSYIYVFFPLSPANRCSSKARRTKHLPWRSWRSGTSWTRGSRSTSALRSSSCRRRTLTSSYGAFSAWQCCCEPDEDFFSSSLISARRFWKQIFWVSKGVSLFFNFFLFTGSTEHSRTESTSTCWWKLV